MDASKQSIAGKELVEGPGPPAPYPPPPLQIDQLSNSPKARQKSSTPAHIAAVALTYPDVSLFIFSKSNPLRRFCIEVSHSLLFERFILFCILCNCVTLGMASNRQGFEETPLGQTLNKLEYLWVGIFTVEALLKIISMGFVLAPGTYLRDGWNVVDFLVVALGYVDIFTSGNMTALRTVRVLRPLRAVTRVRGMKVLVSTMLSSLPMLVDVVLLCAMTFFLWGLVAVQLFAGVLRNRCGEPDFEGAYTQPAGDGLLALHNVTYTVSDDAAGTTCSGPYTADTSWYQLEDGVPSATTGPGGGGYVCTDDSYCTLYGNPNYGMTSFDNILWAWLTIFQCITLESWSDVMYYTQDAVTWWVWPFFVSLIIFGSFYMLALALAVVFVQFTAEAHGDQKGAGGAAGAGGGTAGPELRNTGGGGSEDSEEEGPRESPRARAVRDQRLQKGRSFMLSQGSAYFAEEEVARLHPVRRAAYVVAVSRQLAAVTALLIILNTAVMCVNWYGMPTSVESATNIANYTFTLYFLVEMAVKMTGLGLRRYFADGFNVFDFIVVVVSVTELVLDLIPSVSGIGPLSVLRALRLLRVFRLARHWKELYWVVRAMAKSVVSTSYLLLLTLLFMFIAALMGMQLFGYKFMFCDYVDGASPLCPPGEEVWGDCPNYFYCYLPCSADQYGTWVDAPGSFYNGLAYCQRFCDDGAQPADSAAGGAGAAGATTNTSSNSMAEAPPSGASGTSAGGGGGGGVDGCSYLAMVGKSQVPRAQFDNVFWGMYTVFQLLTGENWNNVAYDAMRSTSPWSALYVVAVLLIGNYLIFSLFIAILCDSFAGAFSAMDSSAFVAGSGQATQRTDSFTRPNQHDSLQPSGPPAALPASGRRGKSRAGGSASGSGSDADSETCNDDDRDDHGERPEPGEARRNSDGDSDESSEAAGSAFGSIHTDLAGLSAAGLTFERSGSGSGGAATVGSGSGRRRRRSSSLSGRGPGSWRGSRDQPNGDDPDACGNMTAAKPAERQRPPLLTPLPLLPGQRPRAAAGVPWQTAEPPLGQAGGNEGQWPQGCHAGASATAQPQPQLQSQSPPGLPPLPPRSAVAGGSDSATGPGLGLGPGPPGQGPLPPLVPGRPVVGQVLDSARDQPDGVSVGGGGKEWPGQGRQAAEEPVKEAVGGSRVEVEAEARASTERTAGGWPGVSAEGEGPQKPGPSKGGRRGRVVPVQEKEATAAAAGLAVAAGSHDSHHSGSNAVYPLPNGAATATATAIITTSMNGMALPRQSSYTGRPAAVTEADLPLGPPAAATSSLATEKGPTSTGTAAVATLAGDASGGGGGVSSFLRSLREVRRSEHLAPFVQGRSLLLFGPDNWLRWRAALLVHHSYFEAVVLGLIVASSVALALDAPSLDPSSRLGTALRILDYIFTGAFAFEAGLKILTFGFIFTGPHAYMRSGWNVLDFAIVLVGVAYIAVTASGIEQSSIQALRVLRTLRALRPLRAASRFEGLRTVVTALFAVLPATANVALVCLLFYLVFAILAVNIFKGKLYNCVDASSGQRLDPFYVMPVGVEMTREWCEGGSVTVEGVTQYFQGSNVSLPPYQLNTSWINLQANFDNVGVAMLSLFQVASLELWVDITFSAVDAVGVDQQPLWNHQPAVVLLFIFFIIVCSFFILNLFVGVTLEKFSELHREQNASSVFMTSQQQDWVDVQKLLLQTRMVMRPVRPYQPAWRVALFDLVTSSLFNNAILAAILINTLFMAMVHVDMTQPWQVCMSYTNLIFTAIFAVEAALKLTAFGVRNYFRDGWNCFDFFVVLVSAASVALDFSSTRNISFMPVLRVLRVVRVIRLIRRAAGLQRLLVTLVHSLPALANVGGIMVLFFTVYGIIGMGLFGGLKYGDYLNRHANFNNFPNAMLVLMRMVTGESWNGIMQDCMITTDCILVTATTTSPATNTTLPAGTYLSPGDPLLDGVPASYLDNQCPLTPAVAVIYFPSFVILCAFILLNMVIAIVLEAMITSGADEALPVSRSMVAQFVDAWSAEDNSATGIIHASRLPLVVAATDQPLGARGAPGGGRSAVQSILMSVDIPVHEGNMVTFLETLHALAGRVAGTELPEIEEDRIIQRYLKKMHLTTARAAAGASGSGGGAATAPGGGGGGGGSFPKYTAAHFLAALYVKAAICGFMARYSMRSRLALLAAADLQSLERRLAEEEAAREEEDAQAKVRWKPPPPP